MSVLECVEVTGSVIELIPNSIVPGFRERGTYLFSSSIDMASLYIDEAPAEPYTSNGISGWRWDPGFYAGQVVAELLDGVGQRIAEFRFDVAPGGAKLGADVFQDMLDELYAFDPALLLGTEAAQASIGSSGEFSSPLLAYARLRQYGEPLLSALRMVSALPLTRLRQERVLMPYHRARRLDAASVRHLLRRPDTAPLVRGKGDFDGGAVPLFDVTRSFESLDNPANRAMTAVLLAVRRRCISVSESLQDLVKGEKDSNTRTALEPRLARKLKFLQELTTKLSQIARLEPFASIRRLEISAAGLNAISAHPAYARAYRFAWSILRPGVAGEMRNESLWLSPTWEIYERWCFAQIASGLRRRYAELRWEMKYSNGRADRIRLVGLGTSMAIEAWLQPRFPAGDSGVDGFRSVSAEFHPDIVITWLAGSARKMLVLDAKYRSSRQNVLDAMRSAHLYQDALRWDGERPICSLLLIPKGGETPWLESPAFHGVQRVGVQVLAPESAATDMEELFGRWLPVCRT
jgi:hypothetical protein